MKIGMTGSRDGISKEAIASFIEYIKSIEITEAHHGDCIGADTLFHNLMISMKVPVVIHPPTVDTYRSYCQGGTAMPCKEYLSRNKDIVNTTDILIAFPSSDKEILRSGTWSTIRYARKSRKSIIIIYPNGTRELT